MALLAKMVVQVLSTLPSITTMPRDWVCVGSVTVGSVTVGSVTVGSVTVGSVTVGSVTVGSVLLVLFSWSETSLSSELSFRRSSEHVRIHPQSRTLRGRWQRRTLPRKTLPLKSRVLQAVNQTFQTFQKRRCQALQHPLIPNLLPTSARTPLQCGS
jgi:hypothetical protein